MDVRNSAQPTCLPALDDPAHRHDAAVGNLQAGSCGSEHRDSIDLIALVGPRRATGGAVAARAWGLRARWRCRLDAQVLTWRKRVQEVVVPARGAFRAGRGRCVPGPVVLIFRAHAVWGDSLNLRVRTRGNGFMRVPASALALVLVLLVSRRHLLSGPGAPA